MYPQINFLDLGLESGHRIEESNMHSRLAGTVALHNHRFQCHGRPSTIIRRPKHMSEDKVVSKMSSSMIVINIKLITVKLITNVQCKSETFPMRFEYESLLTAAQLVITLIYS